MMKNSPTITVMFAYLLTIFSLVMVSSYVSPTNTTRLNKIDTIKVIDTIKQIDVKNKVSLFIGDSHTTNFKNGWQKILCDKTGMVCINSAMGGKTTYYMLDVAVLKLNKNIDYCFIYGGANDMYSNSISPQDAFDNIESISRLCNSHGIKCYILTGFDAKKCTKTSNINYPKRYSKFQELLLTEKINGAKVIDTRIIERSDCWDNLCHMSPKGHKKIADKIIKDLNLKITQ